MHATHHECDKSDPARDHFERSFQRRSRFTEFENDEYESGVQQVKPDQEETIHGVRCFLITKAFQQEWAAVFVERLTDQNRKRDTQGDINQMIGDCHDSMPSF